MAIGTGADVTVEASDLTVIGDDLRAVASGIGLARATVRVIRQNLVWAFGYNVVLIPVAAGILYPFTGWTLNPALAAGAMALSSVSVVLNSLRLRRFRATIDATDRPTTDGQTDPAGGRDGHDPGHPAPRPGVRDERGSRAARRPTASSPSTAGSTYYFCGRGCLLDFRDDPDHYLDPAYVPHM